MRFPSILAIFLVLLFLIVASGCSTPVPIKPAWPAAPKVLTERCDNLKKIEGDKVAITEMLKVIVQKKH